MSDKQDRKARKLEERSKPDRGHSGSLPTMGGPGMVPHHNYAIPPENFHSHSGGGRLAYRPGPGLGQLSIPLGQMGRVPGLSNDLGPPIFMPSLNLGTPKLVGQTTSVAPSSLPNSKMKPPVMSSSATAAAYISDILTYPAAPLPFHSASLKSVPYMATPPSANPALKATSVPNTSLAKPMPISMGSKVPITRVVSGGMDKDSTQPAFTSGNGASVKSSKPSVTKLLTSSESVGSGTAKEEGSQHGQPYYPQPAHVNSPSNSLSKILMTPASAAQDSEHQQPLPDGPAPVQSTAVGVYSSGPAALSTTATSSNVSFADSTRVDRPPHPSAPLMPLPGGTGGVAAKELSQQHQQQQQVKDRLTTAEVASNIIISNPGLTGKHIAAMTNSTQQPSTLLPHSAYSSPIISQPELLAPSHALLNMPLDTGWGFPPQYNSNNMFHNTPSPPVSMAMAAGGSGGHEMLSQQSNGGGLKSRLESAAAATSLPQSPLGGGAGGVVQTSGPSGELSSPGQINNSRPRILRGKRPVDSNWKLDGQSNTALHSPGSPHRSKFQASLKKSALLPLSGGGGGDMGPPPASPGVQGPEGTPSLNHLGGGNRVEDLSGSPRKKPRKQNVVANDDQYASNVPDNHQFSQQLSGEDPALLEGKLTGLRGVSDGGSPPTVPATGGKEVVEIRYLSQLRKSPFPINGVYKLRHHTAHNHFRRYSDVRHREALPISVYDLANDRSCQQRASGWKLLHFSSQLEEVDKVEGDCLTLMEQVQSSLETITDTPNCLLDREALRTTRELLQGNIDRCNRVQSHVEATRGDMFMVMEHKSQVTDVLDKYSNFKSHYSSISPSLSSSSSSQHKSQS